MDYKEFMNAILEEVKITAGEEYDVRLQEITKNNGVIREGIVLVEKGYNLAPAISLERYYELYKSGIGIGELARKVMEENRSIPVNRKVPDEIFTDFERLKGRILYRYINYDRNALMLKEVPHLRTLDLAMVFYYHPEIDDPTDSTVLIRSRDLKEWNISLHDLWELAQKNTPELEPPSILPIRSLISELADCRDDERANEVVFNENEEMPMYVLTNKDRTFGAACLSYQNIFSDISDRFQSSLFILPSSIHEVIILPDSGKFSKKDLEKMVTEINECEVAPYEVLSNHVYHYSRETKELAL